MLYSGITYYYARLSLSTSNDPTPDVEKYLQELPDAIRVFVANGPGSGDQVLALNIIERIHELGFTNNFEVIGYDNPIDSDGSLMKLLRLFDQETALRKGINNIKVANNIDLSVIPFDYFSSHKNTFKQSSLAIYVGTTNYLEPNFGLNKHSYINVAKAKATVRFDPFNLPGISGLDMQLENQALIYDNKASVMHYQLAKSSQTMLQKALVKFSQRNGKKGKIIQQLFQSMQNSTVTTFPIYGLNPSLHRKPVDKLINLITAGATAHLTETSKPLVILLLNNFQEETWFELQQLFRYPKFQSLKHVITNLPTNFKFVDANVASLSQINRLFQAANTTVILRVGFLPHKLFNEIIVKGYPPVYEGANLATLLYNARRYGLPCQSETKLIHSDITQIPSDLAAVMNSICPDSGLQQWQGSPAITPNQVLAPLLQKYANFTRPLSPFPDRVTYSLSELIQQEQPCEKQPAKCAFFQPTKNLDRVASMCANIGLQSVGYSSFESVLQFALERSTDSTKETIEFLGSMGRLGLLFALEGGDYLLFKLFVCSSFIKHILPVCGVSENVRNKVPLMGPLLMLYKYSKSASDFNMEIMLLLTVSLMVSIAGELGGKFVTELCLSRLFDDHDIDEEIDIESKKMR